MREWLPSGTTVAHYHISSRLSAHGLGEVYLAADTKAGRNVALKLLPASIIEDPGYRRRFDKIYSSITKLRHRNICEIYEGGITKDGRPYVAMEYVKGHSLDSLGYGQLLNIDEIISVVIQIADALDGAHSQGWLHLAIKPSNIMLSSSQHVRVLDFGQGLAFPISLSDDLSDPLNITFGAVRYLSPEQIYGDRPDQRSDIFSIGAVFYELVSGHTPFTGTTIDEMIASLTLAEPLPLTEFRDDLSPEVNRIVSKAITRDLKQRYQTAGELARDLRALRAKQREWTKSAASAAEAGSQDTESAGRVGKTAADLGGRSKIDGAKGDRITASSLIADLKQTFRSLLEGARRRKRAQVEPIKLRRERSLIEDLINLVKNYWGRILVASLAILGIIIAILIAGRYLSVERSAGKQQGLLITRITSYGKVTEGTVSPYGERLAFAIDRGAEQSIMIKELDNGKETMLGSVPEKEYRGLTFSPDGRRIAYIKAEPNAGFGDLYQMILAGGAEESLNKGTGIGTVCYSPDGRKIAYLGASENRSETSLKISAVDGTSEVVLAKRQSPAFFDPGGLAWSPDGRVIAGVVKDPESGLYLRIIAIEVDGGGESTISSGRWSEISRMSWLGNGSALIVSAGEPASRASHLWRVAYPSGEVARITRDSSDYRGASLTRDASRLISVQSEALSNIWYASSVDFNQTRQLTTDRFDGFNGLAWTPDNRLVYSSWVGGRETIWRSRLNINDQQPLPVAPEGGLGAEYQPAVAPDGNHIVYVVERPSGTFLWRSDLGRRNLKRLTDENQAFYPSFSSDGKNVIYSVLREGRRVVVKSAIDGGRPLTLIERQSWRPVVSPDGARIACNYWDEKSAQWKIALFPFEGGQPQLIFDAPGNYQRAVRWMPDGNGVAFIVTRGGVSNLWMQPLSGGMPGQMTGFKSGRIFDFAFSRDGQRIAFAQGWVNSDLILIQNFQPSK